MAASIERIRSKVERAKELIAELEARTVVWANEHASGYGVNHDPDTGDRTYYITELPEVPAHLANIAANAIQDLRSPLDHLATRVETRSCGSPPKHRVYFPIADSATQYESLRRRFIKCAGQPAVDAFDATEPYKGGLGHALWQLHQLNKPDKHVLPLAVASSVPGQDISFPFRHMTQMAGLDIDIPPIWAGPRICVREVGQIFMIEPGWMEVNENRRFPFEVAFDEPGVIECEPVLPFLRQVADLVGGVVDRFEPLL
jgi:hypothetical protein